MQFHEMSKYKKGKSPEGDDQFAVTLPSDEEGMVGRQCLDENCQPRYFKIDENIPESDTEESDNTETARNLFCPYCGLEDDIQNFNTKAQIDWITSMFERDVHRMIDYELSKAFKTTSSPPSSKGLFSIELSYKSDPLPSVRHYAEKQLKNIVNCDNCGFRYAVFGISYFCPICKKGNLHLHLKRNFETITSLLNIKPEIERNAGSEAAYHLLGNCLEDCVSLFEGFLKVIYSYGLKQTVSEDERQKKLKSLKNAFQNVSRAESTFQTDLNWKLFDSISQSELDFLGFQFAKRHTITHNLSLVDKKFRDIAQSFQDEGQEVEIRSHDVEQLLKVIEKILAHNIKQLESIIT